ncbi:hypothetical protein GCM10009739_07240 [Microbacterium ulmi]
MQNDLRTGCRDGLGDALPVADVAAHVLLEELSETCTLEEEVIRSGQGVPVQTRAETVQQNGEPSPLETGMPRDENRSSMPVL